MVAKEILQCRFHDKDLPSPEQLKKFYEELDDELRKHKKLILKISEELKGEKNARREYG